MLIIFDNAIINLAHVKEISVAGNEFTFWDRNDKMRLHTFDTEADARKAYEQIISASKNGERICDLRELNQ